jgi:hypothetical protein
LANAERLAEAAAAAASAAAAADDARIGAERRAVAAESALEQARAAAQQAQARAAAADEAAQHAAASAKAEALARAEAETAQSTLRQRLAETEAARDELVRLAETRAAELTAKNAELSRQLSGMRTQALATPPTGPVDEATHRALHDTATGLEADLSVERTAHQRDADAWKTQEAEMRKQLTAMQGLLAIARDAVVRARADLDSAEQDRVRLDRRALQDKATINDLLLQLKTYQKVQTVSNRPA